MSVFVCFGLNVLCLNFLFTGSYLQSKSYDKVVWRLVYSVSFELHVDMIFCLCPLAVPQVMSMQRTTCCLLLRLSHAMLSGKTSISGCCNSEARSCAR